MLALVLFLILLWVVAGIVGVCCPRPLLAVHRRVPTVPVHQRARRFRARAPRRTSNPLVTLVGVVPAGRTRVRLRCAARGRGRRHGVTCPAQRISCRSSGSGSEPRPVRVPGRDRCARPPEAVERLSRGDYQVEPRHGMRMAGAALSREDLGATALNEVVFTCVPGSGQSAVTVNGDVLARWWRRGHCGHPARQHRVLLCHRRPDRLARLGAWVVVPLATQGRFTDPSSCPAKRR
jgi:hypothetical protein